MRLFIFHNGKAMLRPTSRIAKMVSVLATAHRHPASTPQTTRCGACRRSHPICPVPRTNAGKLQRARNTPATISSEITTGDIPTLTSLVGASAAPSQAPAPNPQRIPMDCKRRSRSAGIGGRAALSDSSLRRGQLIQRSTPSPPNRTITGIQKCISHSTAVQRLRHRDLPASTVILSPKPGLFLDSYTNKLKNRLDD